MARAKLTIRVGYGRRTKDVPLHLKLRCAAFFSRTERKQVLYNYCIVLYVYRKFVRFSEDPPLPNVTTQIVADRA